MTRLIEITTKGLLGQFDHHVKFPEEWDFAILYGPNGVGKTKLLELIEAVVRQQFNRISRIPFQEAELRFSDGARLAVRLDTRKASQKSESRRILPKGRVWPTFQLWLPGTKQPLSWSAPFHQDREYQIMLARRLREYGAPLTRVGPDLWRDTRTRQLISVEEALRLYGDPFLLEIDEEGISEPPPKEAVKFLSSIEVHLIETQRLLNFPDRHSTPDRGRGEETQPTVVQFAEDLALRLRAAMTENSRVSQRLDKEFPRRVLEEAQKKSHPATEDRIRRRFGEQSALREELAEIAVLDAAPEVDLPTRKLDRWERIFLWRYLEDTDSKLASFRQVLDRTRLFRDIVNSRFLYKRIQIDREHGFRFVTETGKEIMPTELSSGEQHELVLTYNLLFKVTPGSLVLIDEPEISLHVAWQQDYIDDIRKISQVVDLRFLVATHSPQIINHWWDHAIQLAPFPDEATQK